MALPELRTHTDAIIAALQGFDWGDLDIEIGDGEAPTTEPPHLTVYQLPGGNSTGTLEAPNDDAFIPYQVTCVAVSARQAEWLADRVMALLQTPLDVSGRRIPVVALDGYGGVRRDDSIRPPLFISTPRFRVISTPA